MRNSSIGFCLNCNNLVLLKVLPKNIFVFHKVLLKYICLMNQYFKIEYIHFTTKYIREYNEQTNLPPCLKIINFSANEEYRCCNIF